MPVGQQAHPLPVGVGVDAVVQAKAHTPELGGFQGCPPSAQPGERRHPALAGGDQAGGVVDDARQDQRGGEDGYQCGHRAHLLDSPAARQVWPGPVGWSCLPS
ncbi:hypothetical protein Slala04_66130 [Streptomyces lavendulae subsp. lavendulae]|nr:hypothetical protein Slala04_66130 [Streptomyces lavendulae subsp. lavendulae]